MKPNTRPCPPTSNLCSKRRRPAPGAVRRRLLRDRDRKGLRRARSLFWRLEREVLSILPRAEVEQLARQCGFYRRAPQEIGAFEFALCCALGAVAEGRRGFAPVWRLLGAVAGIEVVRSAVTQRFGKGSAALLERLAHRAIERLPAPEHPELLGKLREFDQVLANDGSVLQLSPLLKKLFPATRTNIVKAAGKLHTTADLVHRRIVHVELTGERHSELAVARSRPIVKNALYINDLGYNSYDYFRDLCDGGAELLARLKEGANPTVVEILHGVRAPRASVGKKLNELELTATHHSFDLVAEFPTSTGTVLLRVVGVRNRETGKYHRYLTSLPPGLLTPEELANLYALRWQIELLFKLLKSSCHLDHLDTGDVDALRTHIYASILAAVILSALMAAAAKSAGISPRFISSLAVGAAAPLLVVPLLLLWLGRRMTPEALAAIIMRTLANGCRDQNPARTIEKWGRLG
jgi:putative transposase